MNKELISLNNWFLSRPKWLQIAATRLLQQSEVTEETIVEIAGLCRQEADGKISNDPCSFFSSAFSQSAVDNLRLCSVSDVEGINALAPKKPLEFGQSNFTVVYGNNGTGKSGYVRLFKHVCGARDLETLHPNVYVPGPVNQKASISYKQASTPKTHIWSGQEPCDDLGRIEIFDNSFGKIFVISEDEVCYEPPALTFFSSLIEVSEKVAAALDAETSQYPSKMPNFPYDKEGTPESNWFKSINPDTTTQDIDRYCKFDDTDESKLVQLQQRVAEKAPSDRARELRIQQKHVESLVEDALKHLEQLSDENCNHVIAARENWVRKKIDTETVAKSTLSSSELDGIGTDTWKELWEAAREYSNLVAYTDEEFPNISSGSRCVLCHQTLTEEAKERFISFENFVKGKFQKAETGAHQDYEASIQSINELPTSEVLETRIEAAFSLSEKIVKQVTEFFAELQNRKNRLIGDNYKTTLHKSLPSSTWIEQAKARSKELGCSAEKFEEDAKTDNREEIKENEGIFGSVTD